MCVFTSRAAHEGAGQEGETLETVFGIYWHVENALPGAYSVVQGYCFQL